MSKLIYVSAQPDITYFHWQCEIYGFNFVQKNVDPSNIHMIFGSNENKSSNFLSKLKNYGYNVHFYIDDRDNKEYLASIKPFLISKWLKDFPELGDIFFLHDSDIIFREKPDYEKYLNDEICYLANAKEYISYNYLMKQSKRYSTLYNIKEFDFINSMCESFGIDSKCVEMNDDLSGGVQYIIKNTKYSDWFKIYKDSNNLYFFLKNFNQKYPINIPVQTWTAEMWSILWNLWCIGKKTKIIEDLNFSWATDDIDIYESKPILHMAGVEEKDKRTKFFKGEFTEINPIEELKKNENFFDFVDKKSSTIKYVDTIKLLIKKQNSDYLYY